MPRTASITLAFLGSGVLIVVGAIVYIAASQAGASFGWFAYQPLSRTVLMGGDFIFMTPLSAVGLGIVVLGLIGFGILVGYLVGRGSRAR